VPNKVDEIERVEDFKWWNPKDPNTFFCISDRKTFGKRDQTSYETGEMITFCYGRKSNAFMLNFYGFCCPGNKFDSIKLLLTKVLKKD
jgi:hypothetical protein